MAFFVECLGSASAIVERFLDFALRKSFCGVFRRHKIWVQFSFIQTAAGNF